MGMRRRLQFGWEFELGSLRYWLWSCLMCLRAAILRSTLDTGNLTLRRKNENALRETEP